MEQKDLLKLSGKELYVKGLEKVNEGKLTPKDFAKLCNFWLSKKKEMRQPLKQDSIVQ